MQTRRARKSAEHWIELVDQFDSSDDSMEQFCRQQDLALSTFQRWRSTIYRSRDLSKEDQTPAFTEMRRPGSKSSIFPSAVTLQIGASITVTIHSAESI